MIEKMVKMFFTDCGREFKKKSSAIHHESVCVCWSNPKNRTCKTCKYNYEVHDSNGMEHDPQYLQKWRYNDCMLNIWQESPEWNQKYGHVDVNVNCEKWEELK